MRVPVFSAPLDADVGPGWIKHWFPEFEFTWLGSEMRENLPKEMDFVHEARNAERASEDFVGIRTSLYIRKLSRLLVLWSVYSHLDSEGDLGTKTRTDHGIYSWRSSR